MISSCCRSFYRSYYDVSIDVCEFFLNHWNWLRESTLSEWRLLCTRSKVLKLSWATQSMSNLHLIPWLTIVLLLDWTQPQTMCNLTINLEFSFWSLKYIWQVIIKFTCSDFRVFIFYISAQGEIYTWHSILEPNEFVSKLHRFNLGY